ncbi:MAG TPA: adenylate/guanylate cyclase domain-containing protein [Candidatus Limnocylindrales bacterium]
MSSRPSSRVLPADVPLGWAAILVLPVAGLGLLLARPELDLQWEHHPSHFWLVLVAAAVNVALAYLTNLVASRHRDARLVLVSLAFLASAGFLALHALATPGVLLQGSNTGFAIATPVGLFVASVLAAVSVTPLAGPRAAIILRRRSLLLWVVVALMAAWALVSLAGMPPLSGPLPAQEAAGPLVALAIAGLPLFAFSAWRCYQLFRRRGGFLPLATAVALVLLGEAMLAIALSRNWRISWWEWHLLMLAGFLVIALGTRAEYRRGGSLSSAFGGLYLEATLARIDRWHARAIAAVAGASERGESAERVLADLRDDGATEDEIDLLGHAAGELQRVDALFRPYLPAHLADRLRTEPSVARLGGDEREVSVLFADLAGFTAFSEQRTPSDVIAMLNAYWEVVVPVIEASGGVVEHFAGDGVMVTFNSAEDQPDHAVRAARTALAIGAAGAALAASNPGWPTFRAGVNSGPAVVGNVGATGRRSFAVIGDTTNVAARLTAAAEPGRVVVSGATWEALGGSRAGEALGSIPVKGKRRAVEAWVLNEA